FSLLLRQNPCVFGLFLFFPPPTVGQFIFWIFQSENLKEDLPLVLNKLNVVIELKISLESDIINP
ncbi:MAG: hypothetical protein AAFY76_03945, partial [Cyanobacteria bacterium J06649_11]